MNDLVELLTQHINMIKSTKIAESYFIDKLEELIFTNQKYNHLAKELETIRNYSIELISLTNDDLIFKLINHDNLSESILNIKTIDYINILDEKPEWINTKVTKGNLYNKRKKARKIELLKRAKHGNIITKLENNSWTRYVPWYNQNFIVHSKLFYDIRRKLYLRTNFHDAIEQDGKGRNKVRRLTNKAKEEANYSLKNKELISENNDLDLIDTDLHQSFERHDWNWLY